MGVEAILGTHRRRLIADAATLATCIDDANTQLRALETCLTACRACAAECERHAHHLEHCRLSAEECRRCERACEDLLAAAGIRCAPSPRG